ncbi:MAG: hypothetical protein C4K60_04025 [Ideonella sp. MAG2]|nr:MAG: hypothetical protein C4K60_04025 [Ideonella sp. MAG2]
MRLLDPDVGTLTREQNGDIRITPPFNFSGAIRFGYVMKDKEGLESTAYISVNFNEENDAPIYLSGSSVNLVGKEDHATFIKEADLLKQFWDAENDALSVVEGEWSTTQPGDTLSLEVAEDGTRYVVLRTPRDATGLRQFSFKVTDGNGGYSEYVTHAVNVLPQNDAPTMTSLVSSTLYEDGWKFGTLGNNQLSTDQAVSRMAVSDILALANDSDGDELSVRVVGDSGVMSDGSRFNVSLGGGADGKSYIEFTLPKDKYGSARFEFELVDAQGATSRHTARLEVLSVNDLPLITVRRLDELSGRTSTNSFFKFGQFGNYVIDVTDVDSDLSAIQYSMLTSPLWGRVHMGTQAIQSITEVRIDNQGGTALAPVLSLSPAASNYFVWEGAGFGRSSREFEVTVRAWDGNQDESGNRYYGETIWKDVVRWDPIVVDLANDGLSFIDLKDSQVRFDQNGDGVLERVSWVAPTDGILAWDYNNDGQITSFDELEFWTHVQPLDPLRTDLESLSAVEFDANQDGRFDALDPRWAQFKLWQDLNSDGISQAGEVKTMDEAGLKTLYLRAQTVNQLYGEHSLVRGFTRTETVDGRLLQTGDVQFTFVDANWQPPAELEGSVGTVVGLTPEEAAAKDREWEAERNAFSRAGSQQFALTTGALKNGATIHQKTLIGASYQAYWYDANWQGHAELFADLGSDQTIEMTTSNGDALPAWLQYWTGDSSMSGTPEASSLGQYSLVIKGRDSTGKEAQATLQLEVAGSNYAPKAYTKPPVQNLMEGEEFKLQLPANVFVDQDAADTVKVTVSRLVAGTDGVKLEALPSWLSYNAATRTLQGTPGADDVGVFSIRVTGADAAQAQANIDIRLVVSGVNDAPELSKPAGNLYMAVNQLSTVELQTDIFADPDGDKLRYALTMADGSALPSWLSYDPLTHSLSGQMPASGLDSRMRLRWTATDLSGGVALTYFDVMPSYIDGLASTALTDGASWSLTLAGGGNDTVSAGLGEDELDGGEGNDVLDGGQDADRMMGGRGDDTFYVDHVSDRVVELLDGGNDLVVSSIDYTLGVNQEQVHLTGAAITARGNANDNLLKGNDQNNVLNAGHGRDTLDGGLGADALTGGSGDDSYYVDNAADLVTEAVDEGWDQVDSSVSYTLTANVENLKLTEGLGTHGTGNELANHIEGNSNANVLIGAGGIDTLEGGSGNDTLQGGDLLDEMIGGVGDDIYTVGNAGMSGRVEYPEVFLFGEKEVQEDIDTVFGGYDTVYSYVDIRFYTDLWDGVEHLVLTGNALEGVGNFLDNLLEGNDLDNVLTDGFRPSGGTTGSDILKGYGGNDTLDGGSGSDFFGSGRDTLDGGDGDDVLLAKDDDDLLIGGNGDDSFYIGVSAGSVEIEEADFGGIDSLHSDRSTTNLASNVENLILLESGNLNFGRLYFYALGDAVHGIGNASNNLMLGNSNNNILEGLSGNDTLNGGEGIDTLYGGLGDDVYRVESLSADGLTGDLIVELTGEGVDTVETSTSIDRLMDNVENVRLMGAEALSATGNALHNSMVGNDAQNLLVGELGNDTLDGGLGADTMRGGQGDDTYVVSDIDDAVIELASEGTDTVQAHISIAQLAGNVENAVLMGNDALSLTGNALNNSLSGNAASNVLDGG